MLLKLPKLFHEGYVEMKTTPKKTPSGKALQKPKSDPAFNTKVVYIIDDDADAVRILTSHLEKHFADVVGFTEPAGAYERIVAQPPDILLLDVMMPEMDGWVFYTRLRAEESLARLPVLFVTCLADHEVEKEMQEDHLCATLPKPVVREELLEKLAQLLT